MATDFTDLINHPEKDEIISRLVRGQQVKEVHDWLKLKYPSEDQKHLRLSQKILKDVITSDFLAYEEQWKKDYFDVQNNIAQNKLSAAIQNNKTYQERLVGFAADKLDIKKMMAEMIFVVQQRIEQVFDAIQLSAGEVGKKEYAFINYLNNFFAMIEKYDKMINDKPDQVVQHTVNVQMIDNYAFQTIEAIRDTMAEVDQEMAMIFMDKLNQRIPNFSFKPDRSVSTEKQKAELQKLQTKFDISLPNAKPTEADSHKALIAHIPDAEFED